MRNPEKWCPTVTHLVAVQWLTAAVTALGLALSLPRVVATVAGLGLAAAIGWLFGHDHDCPDTER